MGKHKITMKELKEIKDIMQKKEVTLYFDLPYIEGKDSYTKNEIFTEILLQKNKFIEDKGIEPKYIMMSEPLTNYLYFQSAINEQKIYGMEILQYKKD